MSAFPVLPRLLLATALLASIAAPAGAATLRLLTTLNGPEVRLSDLFNDAGADAARVLGPGPAPGGRIVVEAPQLAAIAREFGVAWRPASAADVAVLDRPGRMLPRREVMTALRAALTGVGAPTDADIRVPGFEPPLVAPDSHPQAMIEQLDYDAASGRFTGVLAVTGDDMAMQRLRLSGTLTAMVDLPVLAHRLPAGSVIEPQDLRMARVNAGLARSDVVHAAAQAVGLALRHMVMPGQPLPLAVLTRAMAVHNGSRVTMRLQTAGIDLLAQGEAMQAGGIGDHIQVLNPASRAVVEAEVLGPDLVRVEPGSIPLRQASGQQLWAAANRTLDR